MFSSYNVAFHSLINLSPQIPIFPVYPRGAIRIPLRYILISRRLTILIVNTTPEKILYHSVTILIFWWQEQDFRFIFLGSRGLLPVRHRLSRENFHGFHKVIFLDLDEIIEGRIATETSRPPIPFAVGNLQAIVFCGTVHIACAFDLNKIARLKLTQIG